MKKFVCILLTVLFCVMPVASVFAEDSSSSATVTDLQNQSAKVAQLQKDVTEQDQKVTNYNNQINTLQQEINATQVTLNEAEASRAQQEAELEQRMRAMYMYGSGGYLEMMFSATNFTDFMTYFDLTKDIMSADKDMQDKLVATKKTIEDSKAKLEADKASIEQAKADSETTLNEKKKLLEENKDLVSQLEDQLGMSGLSLTYSVTAVAGGTAGAVAQGSPLGWVWPLDASGANAFLITSLMGTRESPGGVGSTDHGGTDIAAAAGTPILAVENGTVNLAGGYGGYGNAVQISHGVLSDGNNYETLYGHMSSIAVSSGQTVTKGQVIGYEGSTGWSTGAHLHFEVHQNGNKINGLSMYDNSILSKLSYSLDA